MSELDLLVVAGELRVRVMETVHSLELRHQRNAAKSLNINAEEGVMGEKVKGARDWLCVWSGMEHLCINVSQQLANQGRGEVFLQVCHSFHLLSVTGDLYISSMYSFNIVIHRTHGSSIFLCFGSLSP